MDVEEIAVIAHLYRRESQFTVVKLLNLGTFEIRPSDEICTTTTPGYKVVKHNDQDCLCISYSQGARTEMQALLKRLIECNQLEKEFRAMECQSTGTQTNDVELYEKATQTLPLKRIANLPISVDKPVHISPTTAHNPNSNSNCNETPNAKEEIKEEKESEIFIVDDDSNSVEIIGSDSEKKPTESTPVKKKTKQQPSVDGKRKASSESPMPKVVTEASSGPSAGQHETQRHLVIVGRHSQPASNRETRCVPNRSSAPGHVLRTLLPKPPAHPSREVPSHCNGGVILLPIKFYGQPSPAQSENNSSVAVQTPLAQSQPLRKIQENVRGPDSLLRGCSSMAPGGLVAGQELPSSVGPRQENLLAERIWKPWADIAEERPKRKRTNSDSDCDHVYKHPKVFDNDADSDEEVSEEETVLQSQVLQFLNTGTDSELRLIPSVSAKKMEVIKMMRPFKGWADLVTKFRGEKTLDRKLLNSAQQVLEARDTMSNLMHNCERIAQYTEKAIAAGSHSITQQPSLINPDLKLKPYQLEGLNWLNVMNRHRLSGILADEMGLGKTIQVIAFLAHLKETGQMEKGSPHLIVVPSSTLDNWCNEFKRWCPSLKVERYTCVMERSNDTDVVLTTYNMIGSWCYSGEDQFFRVQSIVCPFHYAIFDEAEMLKNINSQRYENLIRINALHKLLLIGTPPQNNLLELMSLLAFVMPDIFSGKSEILKFLFLKNSHQNFKKAPLFDQEQFQRAYKVIRPFMLRRLKSDELKDLPAKTATVVRCAMVEDQAAKYEELTVRNDTGQEINSSAIMMKKRKMANHPLTLRYHYQHDKLTKMAPLLLGKPYFGNDAERILEELLSKSDHQLHRMAKKYECLSGWELQDSVITRSGKFLKLDEILPPLKETGHKVLIFSQFVFLLDIMEDYMRIRGHNFLRLDGCTPVHARQNMIDEFNQDDSIFVFLLSTKSGGIGINLPAADTIIIHDIDFNPHNDLQVEGRCHRLGQTRPVTIMRFVSEGTIEEDILRTAEEKLDLGRKFSSLKDDEVMANIDVAQLEVSTRASGGF